MRDVTVPLRLTEREWECLKGAGRNPPTFCEAAAYEAVRAFMLTVPDGLATRHCEHCGEDHPDNGMGHCEDCEAPAVEFVPECPTIPDGRFLCAPCATTTKASLVAKKE